MFCKNCGKEISNDSNFCQYCGINQTTNISDEKQLNKKVIEIPIIKTNLSNKTKFLIAIYIIWALTNLIWWLAEGSGFFNWGNYYDYYVFADFILFVILIPFLLYVIYKFINRIQSK